MNREPNSPPPTEEEFAKMRALEEGEQIREGDFILDINEWADSSTPEGEIVGLEFSAVFRFTHNNA